MEGSPERVFLEGLERGLAAGTAEEPEAVLSLIAGRDVELEPDEVRGAQRRGVQLLAAGGDPQRVLEVDGRAVLAVAEDLDRPERRAVLGAGLEGLRDIAAGLPNVLARIDALAREPDAAWRWFALTILAEELSPDT
jgi:hypothetical protein